MKSTNSTLNIKTRRKKNYKRTNRKKFKIWEINELDKSKVRYDF